jgi:L-iditol 2-dehydrogenase
VKALLLKDFNDLVYTDVPDPQPCGADDVLVAIHACGICGSDVAGLSGRTGRRIPPAIMGHECTGTIAAKGERVSSLSIGDRVVISASQFCGKCAMCRSGRTNMCETHRVLGISCSEYKLDGAYAEYVRIPAHSVYKLPDEVSLVDGALLEPLANAVHAATSLSRDAVREPVVVYGCGTIGLMVIQVLRAYDCPLIIAVDKKEEKLGMAARCGAHLTLNPDCEDVVKRAKELTGGKGVSLCIECVGVEQTVRSALLCVRNGGYLSVVGLMDQEIRLPMQQIVTGEVTVRGNFVYTKEDFLESIRLLQSGAIQMSGFISDVVPLSQGKEAFDRLRSGKENLIKIVLTL